MNTKERKALHDALVVIGILQLKHGKEVLNEEKDKLLPSVVNEVTK